ncbi:hypothetical protein BC941DRAFT_432364 [Chlamydoabsidia padenii]|nr:hypothetical protein BC941DRAFT_432364 [Chlamydoabsidia padenii]
MKNQGTKNSWIHMRKLSSPLEKDFDSDIEDGDQESIEGDTNDSIEGYNSDPIEDASDDSIKQADDMEEAIDNDLDDDDHDDHETDNHKTFKPFKALAGLDQWRPDSSARFHTRHKSALEHQLEAIEKEEDDDYDNDSLSTVLSLDDDDDDNTTAPNISNDSLYQQSQDTHQPPPLSFILDKNQHTNYKTHLPIKEGGLASMALDCINQELVTFQQWQTSMNIEMAKHGSISRFCAQTGGRLCRLVESWQEGGLLFGWCVDDDDDDPSPFLCLFSTAYMNAPHHSIATKLIKASRIGLWPPWTNVAVPMDGKEDVYVHIITKFRMDDLL